MKNFKFERINLSEINEEEYNNLPEKNIFTTKRWLQFISEDAGVKDFILRICDEDGKFLGYFTGFITKKFGIKILGSPFVGWSTCFMGLDLLDRSNQFEIIRAIVKYAYKNEKVIYVEIIDRKITVDQALEENITAFPVGTLQLDVNKDDAGLFKQMKTDCRNFIRQFERRGATIEIAEPDDDFAKDYYDQLIDVFAKQGMVPTYSLDKVKCLLKNLKGSNEILCLRVRNPEGEPIATSIFVGYQKRFFFWGGASYRTQQHYRPNEYMIWTAMQYWRDRGCEIFDMVGVRDYKRKFGSHEEYYARMTFSRFPLLIKGRDLAQKAYFAILKVKGKRKHRE